MAQSGERTGTQQRQNCRKGYLFHEKLIIIPSTIFIVTLSFKQPFSHHRQHHYVTILQLQAGFSTGFSRGSIVVPSATLSVGPVAVLSPVIPLFAHPEHAHFPSPHGQTPVSPPHLHTVFSVPATVSIVFSFSARLPPSADEPAGLPLLISASRLASLWMSRTCLSPLT